MRTWQSDVQRQLRAGPHGRKQMMTEHWQVHMPDGSSQGVAMHVLSAHETLINRWGYSSGVEHLTADQEVPGSNPGAPYHVFVFTHEDTTHTQSCFFHSFQSWTSPDVGAPDQPVMWMDVCLSSLPTCQLPLPFLSSVSPVPAYT